MPPLALAFVCLVQLMVGSNRTTASTIGKAWTGASSSTEEPFRSGAGSSGRTRTHVAGGFIDDADAVARRSVSFARPHKGVQYGAGQRKQEHTEGNGGSYQGTARKVAPVRGTSGPVHTYIKTDKNANFKWGVRHFVGKKYAR